MTCDTGHVTPYPQNVDKKDVFFNPSLALRDGHKIYSDRKEVSLLIELDTTFIGMGSVLSFRAGHYIY